MGPRGATAVVACLLAGVGVAAVVDAVRSEGGAARSASRTPAPGGPAASLVRELEAEGVEGVLYYSDPSDHCRIRALRLPALREAPPPKLRACRFELPQEPGTSALPRGAVWHPARPLAAACVGAHVELSTADGAVSEREAGCTPSWRPDGTLTVIRGGEVWSACTEAGPPAEDACGRKLLSRSELAGAARAVPFVPAGRRFVRSARPLRVVWLSDTRAAVLVRIRLRGQGADLGPLAVVAVYEGRRLVGALPHAGGIDLRASPRRTLVGVLEAGDRVAVVTREGEQWLAAADLPAPAVRAIAWSPDERWIAAATPWSVLLIESAALADGRPPRVLRLPLAAADLAWR
jgi:hypothetical protein